MKKKANNTMNARAIVVLKKHMKHMKIKHKNKKERRTLMNMCCHVYFKKNGKMRSALIPGKDENGRSIMCCEVCHQIFHTHLPSSEEIKEQIVGPMKDINNQMKYIAAMYGAGPKTLDYFATVGAYLGNYSKNAIKMVKFAKKKKDFDQKKKKKKFESSEMGDWSRLR